MQLLGCLALAPKARQRHFVQPTGKAIGSKGQLQGDGLGALQIQERGIAVAVELRRRRDCG
jgi:hypothetical protein